MSTTVALDIANLPVEDRETVVLSRGDYTAEELDFSLAEKLHRLETRYVTRTRPRHEMFRTPEGDIFRNSGDLYIRLCKDGIKRFVAYVHEDSVHHDFRFLDLAINDARNGRMAGWQRHTFKDGDEGWIYDCPNYQINGLKVFKPAYVIVEELSESPGLVGYGSAWGYPCTEPRCLEKLHESDEGSHTLEALENVLSTRGSYDIEICKDMTKPDSDWYVNFWANGDLTELTPEQIATLANDLQWMGIECTNANNRARMLKRDPEATRELMERD